MIEYFSSTLQQTKNDLQALIEDDENVLLNQRYSNKAFLIEFQRVKF